MTTPAGGSRAYARRRGLSAVLIALTVALLTVVPFGPVYAVRPSNPPAEPSPSAPPPAEPTPSPELTAAPETPAPSPEPTPVPTPNKNKPTPTPSPAPTADPNAEAESDYSARVEAVVAIAVAQVDKPYRLGSEGPDLFDCSGLVFRAFHDAGEVGRIGWGRMRAIGYMKWFAARNMLITNEEDAERGDLVIYNNGTHIGIFLGDGRVISATLPGVRVHSLHGLSIPVTAFLAVDWSGKRGPFAPGLVPPTDVPELPATLVPPAAWLPTPPTPELAAGPAILGEEQTAMRTANSRTFLGEDGRYVTEFFTRPIHYQALNEETGLTEWQPIDLRFRMPIEGETGLAIVDTSPMAMILDSADKEQGLIALAAGGASLTLGLDGKDLPAVAPEVALDGTYADYRDLFGAGIGLRVLPRADGFKAYIVLAERPQTGRFTLNADALGIDTLALTFVPEIDGSVTLRDAAGAIFGRLMRPMLLDSSDLEGDGGGVRAAAVALQPEQVDIEGPIEDTSTRLTFTVERTALEEAVYPAYIEISLVDFPNTAASSLHTFAASAHPGANFSTYQRPEAPGYAELWHARRPGREDENVAFLRFAGVHQALAGATVESASLNAFPYWQHVGAQPQSTWVNRVAQEWDLRSVTWDTRPMVVMDEYDAFETTQGVWTGMDLTPYAQAIVTGAAPDYGLMLHAVEMGRDYWKRFVAESTLGGGALEPRLAITWTGLRPVVGTAAQSFDASVPLAWSRIGLSPVPTRLAIQVSKDGFKSYVVRTRLKGDEALATGLALSTADLALGTYEWRVRAKFGDDPKWSAWSDTATFSVVPEVKHEVGRGLVL